MTIAAAGANGLEPRTDKRAYYHLFIAQVLSLVSTGVATVALTLLAYDLVGRDAGVVIGIALSIKMAANIVVAPLAAALVGVLPRRPLLGGLLLARAGIALAMLLVTSPGQVYLLILAFQITAAVFTPAYLAAVPDLLPRKADYARALARGRLAYELEGVMSPAVAAALLLVVSDRGLFVATAVLFVLATSLILGARLPAPGQPGRQPVGQRLVAGARVFLATPRLRGLLALELAVALAAAMVTVNTVVLVQQRLGLGDRGTALAFALFGSGAVIGALLVPRLLQRHPDRRVMLAGGTLVTLTLVAGMGFAGYVVLRLGPGMPAFLMLGLVWLVLGFGCSLAEVPYGTVLCRSSASDSRQSLYATHFALVHVWRLIAYPLAGALGTSLGFPATFALLALIAGGAVAAAAALWPAADARTTGTEDVLSEPRALASEEAR